VLVNSSELFMQDLIVLAIDLVKSASGEGQYIFFLMDEDAHGPTA
jgi:hypothetical protein